MALIYAGFAAFLVGFWFVDHWGTWTTIAFIWPILLAKGILGGYAVGGAVRPFNGNNMLWRYTNPPRSRLTRLLYPREPEIRDFQNDERELRR